MQLQRHEPHIRYISCRDKSFPIYGLPYHSPHKFRHGFAVYGLKKVNTFSEYKAVSQNLSHASINTTDQIYSILSEDDVKERIAGFSNSNPPSNQKEQDDKLKRIMEILNE